VCHTDMHTHHTEMAFVRDDKSVARAEVLRHPITLKLMDSAPVVLSCIVTRHVLGGNGVCQNG